jgi:hypothetical protein
MAALAVLYGLAPVACAPQDLLAPCSMLRCEQLSVGLLRYRLGRAQVYLPVLLADLAYHQLQFWSTSQRSMVHGCIEAQADSANMAARMRMRMGDVQCVSSGGAS